ncbi:MAG: hypothetical protein HN413_11130 [Chloroflexi bacterium]|jgi:photosystem II stability/assembly factor-like uncharacterized protein|nr:hypothetical protein [Chloroflexota bacterium]
MQKRIFLIPALLVALTSFWLVSVAGSADNTADQPFRVYLPIIAASEINYPAFSAWIGPGGGSVTDLIYDPENPNTAFAAVHGHGIFKSEDGGLTWRDVSAGLQNRDVTVVTIAPRNRLVLYAGTYRGGIYKSINGGESWYRSDAGIQGGAISYAIEIDPARTSRVYAATRGESNNGAAPWRGVVYRSEDGGQSWQPVLTNVGGSGEQDWAYDLSIYPHSANIVYAATHEHGAYRSLDYGRSWQAVNNGVGDRTGRAIEPDPRVNTSTVYLGVFHPTGVYKSTNRGDVWSLKTNNVSQVRTYRIAVNPNNKDTLYLGTFDHGIMRSTNAGESWSTAGLSSEIILDVIPRPAHYSQLLSGTLHNGLFRSTNNGGSWEHSQQGLNASKVTSLLVQPGNSQTLYASLYPGWIARSLDGGATWGDYHQGIVDKRVHALVVHPVQTSWLYALTDESGLYRRDTLNGGGWQPAGGNFLSGAVPTAEESVHPFHQDDVFEQLFPDESLPTNLPQAASIPLLCLTFTNTSPAMGYLGTAGGGVYRSMDDGQSWAAMGLAGTSVYALVVVPGEPNRVYAATNRAGSVQMSLDGGATWGDMGLAGVAAYSLTLDTFNHDVLYVGTSNGVYKYIGGIGWVPAALSGSVVTSIAAHPTRANLIYAGTTEGAFISDDGGATWKAGPTELTGIEIQAIQFDTNQPRLVYYATKGFGVLKVSE